MESLSLKDVTARLARNLGDEAKRAGTYTLLLAVSKAILAAFLGTISETLSRSLHDMENRGILGVQGIQIVLHHRSHLQELAG